MAEGELDFHLGFKDDLETHENIIPLETYNNVEDIAEERPASAESSVLINDYEDFEEDTAEEASPEDAGFEWTPGGLQV
jgi:hypothetical protein